MMSARGFTLFELLTTLFILALLLFLGVPSFSKQIQHSRVKTVTHNLLHSVHHTRTLAVSRNQRATLAHKGSWQDGWEVFIDHNNNGTRDEDETLVFEGESVKDVKIYSNGPMTKYISFIGTGESTRVGRADGGSFQAGTMRICSQGTEKGVELILSRGGRMRVKSLNASRCVDFSRLSD